MIKKNCKQVNPKTLKKGIRMGLGKKKVRDNNKQLRTRAAAVRGGDTGAGATLADGQCRAVLGSLTSGSGWGDQGT